MTDSGNAVAHSVRRNLVALISLTVALCGLGYNTWRNESTEAHRNVRQAAFVMLEQLGELQLLVDQRFFGGRRDDANRINCWGRVAMLRDIGVLVSPATAMRSTELAATWEAQLVLLDAGDADAEKAVSASIMSARAQVMNDLVALQ
jgi:hypothetical protein